MKRQLLTAMLLALVLTGTSIVESVDEVTMTVEVILEHEDAIFFDSLELTAEQEKAFRPLYNEYNEKSDVIMANRIAMLKSFMENRGKLTEAQAEEIISQYFAISSNRLALQKEYVDKFKEVLPAAKVARFFQIENKIRALVDLKLAEAMPLIH